MECLAGLPQGFGSFPGGLLRPLKLGFQPGDFIVGKFNFIQLLLGLGEIIQNVLAGGAVFPPEAVNHIQAGLNRLQLLPGIGKVRPPVPQLLRHILNLVH